MVENGWYNCIILANILHDMSFFFIFRIINVALDDSRRFLASESLDIGDSYFGIGQHDRRRTTETMFCILLWIFQL